ncbi:vWA domain-containing protein [Falsibacillus albus]|uniref:VWA domain-containing protein n=1 Tax=Falsibacillus albus TaxID=2478915 RepID=A0A3L7JRY6_9BACI|nr:VWA domain-containing protein [Falsibacillus albus]RLQ93230.1 VWA domain-containing protein [Falsibacillus albus]
MGTIDLQKRSVKIILEKKELTKVTARVGLVLDITGSMRKLYKNGTVQKVVERILAVADQFDDDGELDVWVYDHEFSRLKPVTEKDFDGYVNREILEDDRIHKFGRNDEPPVMKDVLRKYVSEDPSHHPAYIVFINDGGCKKTIKPIIEASADKPVYWQFVGVGDGNFEFLQKLDNQGRFTNNAHFLHIEEIDKISDDELYDRLLNEFPKWLKEAKQKGVLIEKPLEDIAAAKEKPKKKGFWARLFGRL